MAALNSIQKQCAPTATGQWWPGKSSTSVFLLVLALVTSGLLCPNSAPGAAAQQGEKKASVKKAAGEEEAEVESTPGKVPPLLIARPTELTERSLSGQYQFFLGCLHSHSVYSGDHAKTVATKFNNGTANYQMHTPAEVFQKAASNFHDFYFMTDHSSPEQNEFYQNGFTDEHWAATKHQAEAATTASFLAMRGYEFSRNNDPDKGGLGHMNVLYSAAWNSAYAPGHTFAWLYNWMVPQAKSLVVAQFNHPAMQGARGKNFNNYAGRTKTRNEVVRLAEIWNSAEGLHYVPVVEKIWAAGWKVAPTAGGDIHGVFGIENRRMRTGVLAERLTPEAIMQALQARRAYATLEPKLHFEFTLDGHLMGTALDKRPPGDLTVKIFVNDPAGAVISKVEVHGGKYETNGGETKVLVSVPVGKDKKTIEGAVPNGYDFYYATVFKEETDTARAFSSPIWMDND